MPFKQAHLHLTEHISIIQFVCIIISFFTTDRVGRRPLLLGAVVVMCVCLLGIGISGSVIPTKATHNALLALSCIWMAAYSSGIAPVGELGHIVDGSCWSVGSKVD